MLEAVFHIDAKKEYIDSFIWYEQQQEGLGERFIDSVEKLLLRIRQNPLHYPKTNLNFRETVVDTFPFVIVFEVIEKRNFIHIASIHHGKRNPKTKYRKI